MTAPTGGGANTGFQPMPPLTADEYTALRDSIAAHGVLEPVTVDQHGRIIDGHHRRRVCDELGIDCPIRVCQVADDDEAMDLAVTLNAARRQLTQAQKRDLIRAEITRRPGDSDRAIARRVGVDHKTVGAVRRELVGGEIPHPEPADDRHLSRFDRIIAEPDPVVGEALLADWLIDTITEWHEDDPATCPVAHELIPYIAQWATSRWPTWWTFTAVAHRLYVDNRTTVGDWELLGPWLAAIAQVSTEERPPIASTRLAQLVMAIHNPQLDEDTQRLLMRTTHDQLVVAVVEVEHVLKLLGPPPDPAAPASTDSADLLIEPAEETT